MDHGAVMEFTVLGSINSAVRLYRKFLGAFAVLGGIYLLASGFFTLISMIPWVGMVLAPVAGALLVPLQAGIQLQFVQPLRGGAVVAGRIFDGYRENFFGLAAFGLLMSVAGALVGLLVALPLFFMGAGFAKTFCILVAAQLVTGYFNARLVFVPMLILDQQFGWVPAIRKSWTLTGERLWPLLGVVALAGAISFGGVLLLGFGLILTLPFGFAAVAVLYETFCRGTAGTHPAQAVQHE